MTQMPPFDFGPLGNQVTSNMEQIDSKLSKKKITVETGGGLVKVTFSANLRMKKLELDDALIKMNDKEMTEDLIIAAVNKAIEKSQEKVQDVTMEVLGPLGMMLQNNSLFGDGDNE